MMRIMSMTGDDAEVAVAWGMIMRCKNKTMQLSLHLAPATYCPRACFQIRISFLFMIYILNKRMDRHLSIFLLNSDLFCPTLLPSCAPLALQSNYWWKIIELMFNNALLAHLWLLLYFSSICECEKHLTKETFDQRNQNNIFFHVTWSKADQSNLRESTSSIAMLLQLSFVSS